MGLDIYLLNRPYKWGENAELFYRRSDYGLWGWINDFTSSLEKTKWGDKYIVTKINIEDLIIACESCLRNPELVKKLFVSPSMWREGNDGNPRFIKYWLIPIRREMKNILNKWNENSEYYFLVSN